MIPFSFAVDLSNETRDVFREAAELIVRRDGSFGAFHGRSTCLSFSETSSWGKGRCRLAY